MRPDHYVYGVADDAEAARKSIERALSIDRLTLPKIKRRKREARIVSHGQYADLWHRRRRWRRRCRQAHRESISRLEVGACGQRAGSRRAVTSTGRRALDAVQWLPVIRTPARFSASVTTTKRIASKRSATRPSIRQFSCASRKRSRHTRGRLSVRTNRRTSTTKARSRSSSARADDASRRPTRGSTSQATLFQRGLGSGLAEAHHANSRPARTSSRRARSVPGW